MALESRSLASGELPTSNGTLLAIRDQITEIHSFIIVNNNASPVTVNLFLRRPVDTANRRILPKDLTLPANAAYYSNGDAKIYTSPGDLIIGIASSTLVDYSFFGLLDV